MTKCHSPQPGFFSSPELQQLPSQGQPFLGWSHLQGSKRRAGFTRKQYQGEFVGTAGHWAGSKKRRGKQTLQGSCLKGKGLNLHLRHFSSQPGQMQRERGKGKSPIRKAADVTDVLWPEIPLAPAKPTSRRGSIKQPAPDEAARPGGGVPLRSLVGFYARPCLPYKDTLPHVACSVSSPRRAR